MKFKFKVMIIVAPLVFLLDQLTKYLITSKMLIGEHLSVVGGVFDIVHFTNSGAAFGMFSGSGFSAWRMPFFFVVSIVALIVISVYIKKASDAERLLPLALSLVVGGIFGNGLDRARFGEVTDFLSVHIGRFEWPAFNVADSAITVAMVLLVISAFRRTEGK